MSPARLALWTCAVLGGVAPLAAQSTLGHPPNLRAPWTLAPGEGAFSIGHRFELISGGDELLNIPTLSLGFGLPWRLAVGVDYTSNSEIVFTRLGGNEAQFWLGAPVYRSPRAALEALVAHNTAAGGLDGALTGRFRTGRLAALAEARGFTNVLGTGEGGAAWAIGGVVHLTPLLELSADVGRLFGHDSLSSVWSAGVALGIPGTPHTLALQVTNGGAMTLQGTSRPKVLGPESVRYGFVFTAPLGSASQWARIFRRGGDREAADTLAAVTVEMRQIALAPREVRIRAGQAVAWVNHDPLVHTATADDGSWDSGPMVEGARWTRTFDRPGRYLYHCTPHPQMRGVVIVEP